MVLKFISRVLMFLSIPAVLLGGWAVFIITLDYRSYHSSLPVPEGRDIVVCGDSHSKDCIDPDCFLRLHNFSTAASDPEQNYLRLKDVLKTNTSNLKYVLLDITPLQLGFNERRETLSELGASRVHALLHFYHYKDTTRQFGSIAQLFRDVVLVRKFHELRKAIRKGAPYRSSLTGAFDPVQTKGFIDHPQKAQSDLSRKVSSFNKEKPFELSDRLAFFIRKQADAVRDAGLSPIFMMTPVSPQMLTQMDANLVDSLTNGVAKIAAEYDALFFNYLGTSFPVDCWRDANHMNAKGATSFSTIFQNDFNASISTQTHNGVRHNTNGQQQ